MKGKDYLSRKNRPEGDFYPTPKSLAWVAEKIIKREFQDKIIFDPCAGEFQLAEEIEKMSYSVPSNDLYNDKCVWKIDYTDMVNSYTHLHFDQVIANPPFSLWDEFVLKAKMHCKKFMFIGRLNYFGTQSRLKKEIWEGLKGFYPFSRYVDYRTPPREDGHFHVGGMATAWFLWEDGYSGKKDFDILDVQKYATLGNYKELNHE
jgi:hypothetical protein